MSKTSIEWADFSSNSISGCTRASEGCRNCYAIKQSFRCAAMGMEKYEGVAVKTDDKFEWTGKIKLHPEVLDEPGQRKKKTRYFINSMSDTFHDDVPHVFIDKILQMVLNCPQHEFMILTKRPRNIMVYIDSMPHRIHYLDQAKNLILMTSVENQAIANRRINDLMEVRSRVPGFPIGLSCEPLLGPIDFGIIDHPCDVLKFMNWIICGGESGPDARPMHPDWARSIRDQCLIKNVPFFFKQFGEWSIEKGSEKNKWGVLDIEGTFFEKTSAWNGITGDASETKEVYLLRVGKKKAGRILDGRTWSELPDLMRDRR